MHPADTARTLQTCVVTDDHDLMLTTTASVLESGGYSIVGVASTAADSLRAIEEAQPDLAVVDFELPDMTGVELAAKLRTVSPGTQIVLHSARIDSITVAAALATGIRGIVVKGSADRLLEAVAELKEGRTYVDPTLASPVGDASPSPPRPDGA